MKHPATRILFAYWDELRGERAAPDRSEVQPGAMRQVLSDAFVLSNDEEVVFRHAGGRVCALFGRDLASFPFRDVWSIEDMAEIDRLLGFVTLDTTGVVLGAVGVNSNRSEIAMEMLLLPLRHGRRTGSRVLGALSPATIPSWAGLVPLEELRIQSVRTIETRKPPGPAPEFRLPAERRNPLVLHDGGRP